MDKAHLHWYTREIEFHTRLALATFKDLMRLLEDPEYRQSDLLWFALTSFLGHSAMVSKFFDPTYPLTEHKKQRAADLMLYFGIKNDSPILSRVARDNLEHFDERIDNWVNAEAESALQLVVDDRDGYAFLCEEKAPRIWRVLIADEKIFISENRNGKPVEMDLIPMNFALLELYSICKEKLVADSPYHYLLGQAIKGLDRQE